MKKLLGISTTIALGCLLCSSNAFALPTYGFDSDGTDGPAFDQVSGFKLLGVGGFGNELENAPASGGSGLLDIWSRTDFNTLTFLEEFTLSIDKGLNSIGTIGFDYGAANLNVDFNLDGSLTAPDVNGNYTVSFNTGSTHTMYFDFNGDDDFNVLDGDVEVATLGLTKALPFFFESTLLGSGTSASVDLQFDFLSANPLFWDTPFENIVSQGFMLAIAQGDLTLQDLEPDLPVNGIQYQGWSVIAADASLTPVPEPATMLLFGAGLIGLAGIGRRKRS